MTDSYVSRVSDEPVSQQPRREWVPSTVRPTGKLALVLIVVAALGSSARAHAAPGDLDQSFSLDGFEPVLSPSDPQALAVQPNGAAVVAGASSVAGEIYASVARYTADGPLDRTFGADGEVLLAIGEPPRDDGISTSYLHDVEVAPNGSILVAGSISIDAEGDPNDYDWLIARLRPDGSLDPSFSDDGVLTLDIGWGGRRPVGARRRWSHHRKRRRRRRAAAS